MHGSYLIMLGNDCLGRFVEAVKARWRTYAVILYGSRARGDWKPWSDWDILVVADFEEPFLERLNKLLELSCPGIEPIGYTREEFEDGLTRLNPTIISALVEGRPLYGEDYVHAVRRRIKRVERIGTTWIVELAD